jgi:hypothetical protein
MQTHTNNLRAGREPSYKRIGPWANHDRRIVVDKHNVDTGIREYAMRILPDADDRLCPKAQKIVRKVCGNWEFPIVRDNRPLMCFKIHRSPKSHRIAVLPTSYLGLLASDGQSGTYRARFSVSLFCRVTYSLDQW